MCVCAAHGLTALASATRASLERLTLQDLSELDDNGIRALSHCQNLQVNERKYTYMHTYMYKHTHTNKYEYTFP